MTDPYSDYIKIITPFSNKDVKSVEDLQSNSNSDYPI